MRKSTISTADLLAYRIYKEILLAVDIYCNLFLIRESREDIL